MAEAESLETAAEHERILREIESTDTACIGPTLRYPACRGRRRAGTGGTGGQATSGPCVWPAARRASSGPTLRRARRATSTLCEAGLHPQLDRGSLPGDRRLPQPSYSEGSSCCLPPGWGSLRPPRLAGCCATIQCAGLMVVLSRSFPEDITLLPPCQTPSCPRHKSCSSDKTEFYPTACCSEIKL